MEHKNGTVGALKAPPEEKLHFRHLFMIQMTQKISMTMPPILFRGLEMAKKGVSIAFLLSVGPKFGSKNVVFWPF